MSEQSEVPVGQVGRILDGADAGKLVKVVDDSGGTTGGYYVLIWPEGADTSQGHDDWVESAEHLAAYFQEAGWHLVWGLEEA